MNEKSKKTMRKEVDTITVMFIDQTVGGVLARRLQEAEDRIAEITGYRIRMVESSGTQLRRILPNTNPWSGQDCSRLTCYNMQPRRGNKAGLQETESSL